MWHPVENSLVHKTSVNQVLLVSAESKSEGTLKLGVALSSEHPSAHTIPAASTLLGVELMRQCAIAFAHLAGGVPRGWAFLMNELTFAWDGESVPTTPGQFTGHVNVALRTVRMRKDQVSNLQLEASYVSRGVVLGSGRGDLSCLPPRAYQAIRRNASPATNASTGPLGTVLADTHQGAETLNARLVWNREDRFIFDHPSDHLSGMLLASGLLETHVLLTGSQASDFTLQCKNFAEYDAPVQVSGSVTGPGQTLTTIIQSGHTIAVGRCGGPRATGIPGHAPGHSNRLLTPSA